MRGSFRQIQRTSWVAAQILRKSTSEPFRDEYESMTIISFLTPWLGVGDFDNNRHYYQRRCCQLKRTIFVATFRNAENLAIRQNSFSGFCDPAEPNQLKKRTRHYC